MPDRPDLELSFRTEMRDALYAAYWGLLRNPGVKGLLGISLFILCMACLAVIRLGALGIVALPCLLFVPGVMLFMFVGVFLTVVWGVKKNPHARDVARLSVSEEGIQTVSATQERLMPWASFRQVVETRYAFMLILSTRAILCLPKRNFADGQQLSDFRDLLEKHLDERADVWVR